MLQWEYRLCLFQLLCFWNVEDNKFPGFESVSVISKLLYSKTIGTRYVAGRYICIECGARGNPVITSSNNKIEFEINTAGAFDYVTHTDDCQLAKLIKLIRGY